MRIHSIDQRSRFPAHLQRLRAVPVMPYRSAELREKVTSCDLGPSEEVDERAEALLFTYRIFPPGIMAPFTEWDHWGRGIRPGDTIVQQIHLPPWPRYSQKIVLGVRVKEVFRENERSGFSYETLVGHVEKGISTFTLHRHDGRTSFTIHTRSGAGHPLIGMMAPVISRPYQAYCTRRALAHMQAQLRTCKAAGKEPVGRR